MAAIGRLSSVSAGQQQSKFLVEGHLFVLLGKMCFGFICCCWSTKNPPPLAYKLDYSYCYDFTNVTPSGVEYKRGGLVYNPPYGWRRFALSKSEIKKLMKNKKMNMDNIEMFKRMLEATRSLDSPYTPADGDWAVSYRGLDGYAMDETVDTTGKSAGLCSTPDIQVAARFGKIVWQMLVNTRNLKTDAIDKEGNEYWVASSEQDIVRIAYLVPPNRVLSPDN